MGWLQHRPTSLLPFWIFVGFVFISTFVFLYRFLHRFFQQYAWGLVNIRVTDVDDKYRYIFVYPYNYVYIFDLSTHTLKQPYISGNFVCDDPEYFDSVIVLDYHNLDAQNEWKVSCVPNIYFEVVDYFKNVDPQQIYTFNLGRKSGTYYYSSFEIINELIGAGIITLEKPTPSKDADA